MSDPEPACKTLLGPVLSSYYSKYVIIYFYYHLSFRKSSNSLSKLANLYLKNNSNCVARRFCACSYVAIIERKLCFANERLVQNFTL